MLIEKTKVVDFYKEIKRTPKFWKRKKLNSISDWQISKICKIQKTKNKKGQYVPGITIKYLEYLVGSAITCNDITLTIYAATILAYAPAFQHVMEYKEKDLNKRIIIREKATNYAFELFSDLVSHDYASFDDFWKKSKTIMIALRKYYHDMGETDFTIGNAQKWLNIFIKHYYCLCCLNVASSDIVSITESHLFEVASFAVDSLMIDKVILPLLHLDFMKNYSHGKTWGNCDDINAFESYEQDVWNKVKIDPSIKSLFHWEFLQWKPKAEITK